VSSFDGTITADIPAARLTELFNCNNFIVSQVNPHINFVLHLAEEGQGRRLQQAGPPHSSTLRLHLSSFGRVRWAIWVRWAISVTNTAEVKVRSVRMYRPWRPARSGDRRAAVSKLLRVANFLLLNIKYGVQKLLEAGGLLRTSTRP